MLPGLQQFDQRTVHLIALTNRIGPWTRTHDLTELQFAACQLVPPAMSLVASMRELIRQGYLLGAAVLLRPIIERIATLSWLCKHPEKVHQWHNGWEHGDRPNLHERMAAMPGGASVEESRAVIQEFNGLVHGDPDASEHGSHPAAGWRCRLHSQQGSWVSVPGRRNLPSKARCSPSRSTICARTSSLNRAEPRPAPPSPRAPKAKKAPWVP